MKNVVVVTFFLPKAHVGERELREEKKKHDVRPALQTNGQRRHRVLFALFQRIRVSLRGDAREEEIRFGRFGSRGEEEEGTGDDAREEENEEEEFVAAGFQRYHQR